MNRTNQALFLDGVLSDIKEIDDIAVFFSERGKKDNAAFLQDLAGKIRILHDESIRFQRLHFDVERFFNWFNYTYPDPNGNQEHPYELLASTLSEFECYIDE